MAEQPDDLARRFAAMGRTLLGKRSVQEMLDGIVALAVDMVDGCDHAGVLTARRDGGVETAAVSDEVVRRSDALQEELREGPCYDALWEEETFETADMARETRWPRYSPHAVELGIRSALGFQLSTGEGTMGALDLYADRPHAFGDRSRDIGTLFAAHAAVALAWSRTEAQLHDAVETRQVIGQAVGILMERGRLTSAAAFDELRRVSQTRNVKLRDVALRVVARSEEAGRHGRAAPPAP
jgi:transcriptional regulator with GAF, ATPase, and Fis domain